MGSWAGGQGSPGSLPGKGWYRSRSAMRLDGRHAYLEAIFRRRPADGMVSRLYSSQRASYGACRLDGPKAERITDNVFSSARADTGRRQAARDAPSHATRGRSGRLIYASRATRLPAHIRSPLRHEAVPSDAFITAVHAKRIAFKVDPEGLPRACVGRLLQVTPLHRTDERQAVNRHTLEKFLKPKGRHLLILTRLALRACTLIGTTRRRAVTAGQPPTVPAAPGPRAGSG
ncbi:hypothetical protein BC793_108365 [Actinoplanes xinjiangensis]|uniref:Uncharacterized protein n=1 Tax=Actinoplanes xinjiangensis TaxID=512350 RepID=A0A316FHG8_9ACTN|nr:hypothetical protein BC793_108365 [Actinoplanes xinjiangensis]